MADLGRSQDSNDKEDAHFPTSLWRLIPLRIRLSLLPLFASAFLVGAGKELGLVLTPIFGRGASASAAADVAAMLLLCNLVAALWVFYRVLELELQECTAKPQGGTFKADLAARFISFAAIFVTVANLFKLSVQPDQSYNIAIYGIVVVFYLLVVPFFMIFVRASADTAPERLKEDLLLLFLRMVARTSLYAVSMGVLVLLFTLSFFVLLNDGWNFIWKSPRFIIDVLEQENPREYWVINQSLMAVAALQLCIIEFSRIWLNKDGFELFIPVSRLAVVVAVSVALICVMAVIMLKSNNLLAQGSAAASPFDLPVWMKLAQGTIGLIYAGIFFAAFYVARPVMRASRTLRWTAGASVFALFGLIAGAAALYTRMTVSLSIGSEQLNLLWMHSVAFVLAFLGLWTGSRLLSRHMTGVAPLLPVVSRLPADRQFMPTAA